MNKMSCFHFSQYIRQIKNLELDELPTWPLFFQLIGLLFVSASLLLMVTWFLFIPQYQQIEALKSHQSELLLEQKSKFRALATLVEENSQRQQQKQRYQQLLRQLPTQTELADLLANINQLGSQYSLVFTRIDWGEAQKQDFLYRLPLNIELHGEFHNIGQFVQSITQLPRLIRFSSVKWQRTSLDRSEVTVQMKAYIYRLNEDSLNIGKESLNALLSTPLNERDDEKRSDTKIEAVSMVEAYQQKQRNPFQLPGYRTTSEADNNVNCQSFTLNSAMAVKNNENQPSITALKRPLNEFHFKGIISRNRERSAIIQTAVGELVLVQKGDLIGLNQGVVADINEHHLIINEIVNNRMGCKSNRQLTLTLNRENVGVSGPLETLNTTDNAHFSKDIQ